MEGQGLGQPMVEFNAELLKNVQDFYSAAFGKMVDIGNLKVLPQPDQDPEKPTEYALLVVLKGMTLKEIVKANKSECKIILDPRLDLSIMEIKSPGEIYRNTTAWMIDSAEPDRLVGRQSDLNRHGIGSISECLIQAIEFHYRTGKYMNHARPTISASYVVVKGNICPLIIRFDRGGLFVTYTDKNTIGGGRLVYNQIW